MKQLNSVGLTQYIFAYLVILFISLPVLAGGPAALVEEVDPSRTDVMFMDMLEPGKIIKLGANEKLVLSYLISCRQETITGGKITVGSAESTVENGAVVAKVIACVSGLVEATGNEAGAVVFRAPPGAYLLPKPDKTIYSLYPIFKTSPAASNAILIRLDRNEREMKIHLVNGVADLRKTKTKLKRHALYKVSAGDKEAIFLVHAKAKSSEKEILRRFVAF